MTQSEHASGSPLEYASPRTNALHPSIGLRKVIIGCWLIPFAVGLLILFGWLGTAGRIFPVLGLVCILTGTVMAGVGGILLIVLLAQELRAGEPTGRALMRFFLLAALLASNFGTAWLCMMVAEAAHPMAFGD